MNKIGYYGGNFSPLHKGHFKVIESASKECQTVNLYISLAGRKKNSEFHVKGESMNEVWSKYLLKILPENVKPIFIQTPVRAIYEMIGSYDKQKENNFIHVIYSDDIDMASSFPEKSLLKYFPKLTENKQIETKAISRMDTAVISGSEMRKYIQFNLFEEFTRGLPETLQQNSKQIWEILTRK